MRGESKNNNTIFYVQIAGLGKKSKEHYFEFKQKVDDEYKVISTELGIKGVITGYKCEHYTTKEGKDARAFKFTIENEELQETYFMSVTESNVGRQILNSILSLEELLTPIRIELYMAKGKGVNEGKKFKNVSVKFQNMDTVGWKIPKMEQDSMIYAIKDEDGTVVKNNYSKLDKYLEEQLSDWSKKVGLKELTKRETENKNTQNELNDIQNKVGNSVGENVGKEEQHPSIIEDDDSDLPF